MKLHYAHLETSYNRERQLITNKDFDDSYIISVEDVLKAHYLICEYFEDETGEQSLYGIKNYNLLSSAVARQSVAIGNIYKYKNDIEKAATVFYGLVKNHAFHDGNKRTALLSLLYFLSKINRVPTENQRKFEKLTENVAADKYSDYKGWKDFYKRSVKKCKSDTDIKIDFIASEIRSLTTKKDESYKTLTYRELDTALHPYNFYLEPVGTQEINLCYKYKSFLGKIKTVKLYQIGFKGWSRQVYEKSFKCIFSKIREKIDIDVGTILRGGEPMYKLIETFAAPLSRLKDK